MNGDKAIETIDGEENLQENACPTASQTKEVFLKDFKRKFAILGMNPPELTNIFIRVLDHGSRTVTKGMKAEFVYHSDKLPELFEDGIVIATRDVESPWSNGDQVALNIWRLHNDQDIVKRAYSKVQKEIKALMSEHEVTEYEVSLYEITHVPGRRQMRLIFFVDAKMVDRQHMKRGMRFPVKFEKDTLEYKALQRVAEAQKTRENPKEASDLLIDQVAKHAIKEMTAQGRNAFRTVMTTRGFPRKSQEAWNTHQLWTRKAPVPQHVKSAYVKGGVLHIRVQLTPNATWISGRIEIEGVTLPDTIVNAAIGSPIEKIVDHPFLKDLTIKSIKTVDTGIEIGTEIKVTPWKLAYPDDQ